MKVKVNGQCMEIPFETSLRSFLKDFCLEETAPRIAVALNDRIAYPSEWNSLQLKENDQIEIIHAIQGG